MAFLGGSTAQETQNISSNYIMHGAGNSEGVVVNYGVLPNIEHGGHVPIDKGYVQNNSVNNVGSIMATGSPILTLRRRGRPRLTEKVEGVVKPRLEGVVKRGRGRPRLKPIMGKEEINMNKILAAPEISDIGGAAKRGRGRPRLKPINGEEESGLKNSEAPKKNQPVAPRIIERPVRERKLVQRLISLSSAEKTRQREFVIEKGSGTPLKDIPNVAYKLSKRNKADQTLKLLHSVLYGKRLKGLHIKNNILQFSGFVKSDNKNSVRVQAKLEKLHKDILASLCDILDLQYSKTASKKEEMIAKLLEFLGNPHTTQNIWIEEKDQRPNIFRGSSREEDAKNEFNVSCGKADKEIKHEESEYGKEPEKEPFEKDNLKEEHDVQEYGTNMSDKIGAKRKRDEINMENREAEKQGNQINMIVLHSFLKSSDQNSNTDNVGKKKRGRKPRNPLKSNPGDNSTVAKDTFTNNQYMHGKAEAAPGTMEIKKKRGRKPRDPSKSNFGENFIGTTYAARTNQYMHEGTPGAMKMNKKRGRKPRVVLNPSPVDYFIGAKDAVRNYQYMYDKSEATHSNMETKYQIDEMTERRNKLHGEASVSDPTDDELRAVIRDLLNEVDFDTATLSDVVKQLGKHFNKDFSDCKAYLRSLVQEELTRIADEEDYYDCED